MLSFDSLVGDKACEGLWAQREFLNYKKPKNLLTYKVKVILYSIFLFSRNEVDAK